MDQNFGVATRLELVPFGIELIAELEVVVDLAILHHDQRAILVFNGLVSASEVNDRQSAIAHRESIAGKKPGAIRTAMVQSRRHAAEQVGVRESGKSKNRTHGLMISEGSSGGYIQQRRQP